jgi:hypothetical protein
LCFFAKKKKKRKSGCWICHFLSGCLARKCTVKVCVLFCSDHKWLQDFYIDFSPLAWVVVLLLSLIHIALKAKKWCHKDEYNTLDGEFDMCFSGKLGECSELILLFLNRRLWLGFINKATHNRAIQHCSLTFKHTHTSKGTNTQCLEASTSTHEGNKKGPNLRVSHIGIAAIP